MIPRMRIAILPTPIDAMPRLSAELRGPSLYVKRDDLTGLAFGGNKIRKLEFVLAEALAAGAKTLVTTGGIQSNHCRQTAALAAKYGMGCILVLSGEEPELFNGNLLVAKIMGAEIVWCERPERDEVLDSTFQKAWESGLRPHKIPLGASNPTGTLGYAFAMEELFSQGLNVDWIIVPSSSAGTQAGMVLGAKRAGWDGKILGISIDVEKKELQEKVADLATQASERLGEKIRILPDEIIVNTDYLGDGYAVMGNAEIDAINLLGRTEGLVVGPVYTGRSAAGMIDLIQKGFFKQEETVLFWHTGDNSTIFADPYAGQLSQ